MKGLSILSAYFLCSLLFFSWGYASVKYDIFPYAIITKYTQDIHGFLFGGEGDNKSLREKIANDLNIVPSRKLVTDTSNSSRSYVDLEISGLSKRRIKPKIYIQNDNALEDGYLLIWGTFDFSTGSLGGILLNKDYQVINTWIPSAKDIRKTVHEYNKHHEENIIHKSAETQFSHGIVLMRDGSILYNDGDAGNGMHKIDYCSQTKWIKLGKFNHTITKANNREHVWTIDGASTHLHRIKAKTGETVQVITIEDIITANPDVDPLLLRRNFIIGEWLHDHLHINDVEEFPSEYEKSFVGFDANDLLLSFRSLNLVVVVDSKTLKIKWWRIGEYSRQHDPDWQSDGTITVYDNQMRDKKKLNYKNESEKFSRIVSIDPENYRVRMLYDGVQDAFYSNIRGKHQIIPDNKLLITSSMQGRVLLVNDKGETILEFLNAYDEENNMLISEALWVPQDFFDFPVEGETCESQEDLGKDWTPTDDMSIHYAVEEVIS